MIDPLLLLGLVVAVLIMSLVARALSCYFRIPFIIFLLIEGIMVGPEVLNLLDPALYIEGLSAIVAISISVIVFDGGLHIDLKHIRMVQESVLKLTTIGVLVTFLGTTVLTSLLIGIPLELAALFGALVTATGPTVITPIVRDIKISHRLGKILELEGVLNDAASVILAAMIFEWVAAELSGTDAVLFIIYRLGIGIAIGSLSGFALQWFFTRGIAFSKQTARLVSLTAVFTCFFLSEYLGNESGILAVAIFGIILGSSEFPYKETIKEFKGDIVTVVLSLIFILLAAMLKFEDIQRIGISGIFLVLLLVFLIRPMAVFVSMWKSRIGTNEKLFLSFIGPRGVVPTSVATYFAIKLDSMNIPGGQTLVGLVFLTVIITVFLSGTLSKKVAEVLEVIPMEILIIGGGKVGRILAERFDKRGENVVVVDISEDNCKKCMELGIRTVQGDAGDVSVLKKAGIENAKYVVATTNKDDTNLLFCQIAKASFGFRGDQLVARVNEIENLQAFWNLGIRAISPAMTTAVMLDNIIGRPHLFSMCEVGGEGDMMEIKVTNSRVIGKAIKDIQFPVKSLLVMVQRGSDSIIAHGSLVLEYGDIVTVIGEGDAAKKTANILCK